MLTGTYNRRIDKKGRLTLPKLIRYRNEEESYYIIPLVGPCLSLYEMKDWEDLHSKFNSLPKSHYDLFISKYISKSHFIRMDNYSKILIPKSLLEYAEIEKDIIVVGMLNHINIWNPDKYPHGNDVINDPVDEISRKYKTDNVGMNFNIELGNGTDDFHSKVFISYSRIDEDFVKSICETLSEINIDYFLDVKDINWGDSIKSKIKIALKQCKAMIVILSPASIRSQWVPFEIGQAIGNDKLILPILTHPSIEVPSYLTDLNYIVNINDIKKYFNPFSKNGV